MFAGLETHAYCSYVASDLVGPRPVNMSFSTAGFRDTKVPNLSFFNSFSA